MKTLTLVEIPVHPENKFCNRCRFIEWMPDNHADYCIAYEEFIERDDSMVKRCDKCLFLAKKVKQPLEDECQK